MYEQCLTLVPFFSFTFLNDAIFVALYFPWFSYVGTWFLSTAFYDGETFFINALVNYIGFAIFYNLTHIIGVISPAAIPCESILFNSYRYIFPSPTYITALSYYGLLVMYHRRKRDEWWGNRNIISNWLLCVIIVGFPLSYMIALMYYGIMPWYILLSNTTLAVLLVAALMEFSKSNRLWKGAAKTLNVFMGWAIRT